MIGCFRHGCNADWLDSSQHWNNFTQTVGMKTRFHPNIATRRTRLCTVGTHGRGSAGASGHAHTLSFAIHSRDGGRAAAKEALGALRAACERMSLTLSGQRVVLIQPVYSDVLRAPDLRSFRGLLRVRIITEEAA